MGCIPRSMRAKAILKRIFYGRLDCIPPAIGSRGPAEPMIPVDGGIDLTRYRTSVFRSPEVADDARACARRSFFPYPQRFCGGRGTGRDLPRCRTARSFHEQEDLRRFEANLAAFLGAGA